MTRATWSRAVRPKATKLATPPALAALVSAKLALDWSPQQIAVAQDRVPR
jgi:IS30 family transposase